MSMEQRWGFLGPWCAALKGRFRYKFPNRPPEHWGIKRLYLQVDLSSFRGQRAASEFQKVCEAFKLLAAVAHVDDAAWKYLLRKYCDARIGKRGEQFFEDVPVRFLLQMGFGVDFTKEQEGFLVEHLVQLCGVDQRRRPSEEYLSALAMIAVLDNKLQRGGRGVDIDVPVRVLFKAHKTNFMERSMEVLLAIQRAEELIKTQWAEYEGSVGEQEVVPGALRCTIVMEPMMATFDDSFACSWMERYKVVDMLESLVRGNVFFSQVAMRLGQDYNRFFGTKDLYQRLMARLFDNNRRDGLHAKYYNQLSPPTSPPLQFGTVRIIADMSMRPLDFEAMGSALAVNQATRTLSLRLGMALDEPKNTTQWWKWLAYGLFSKRARACSSLENLALLTIRSMSEEDIEGFIAVLTSEHPEADLLGTPHGLVDDRDGVIRRGALVRRQVPENMREPCPRESLETSFESPLFVRTFSDDGTSAWVNVMISGYGWCQVQRNDLNFDGVAPPGEAGDLASLTITFDDYGTNISTGLPAFLEAVGPTLKSLSIGDAEVDEGLILRSCPNLGELALNGDWMSLRFNFSECLVNNLPLPSVKSEWNWSDVIYLSKELSEAANPLAKCLRRLRVYVIDPTKYRFDGEAPDIVSQMEALLEMLGANKTLEYLDLVVPLSVQHYLEDFLKHHLTPVNRSDKLSTKNKVAFLSVLPCLGSSKADAGMEPDKLSIPLTTAQLDRLVVSKILSFAAPPALRQVFFRDDDGSEWCYDWGLDVSPTI